MKILVLSHMYPSTANDVAGIFVHLQVKALMAKGVEARVISPSPWSPFPVNRLSPKWRNYSMIPRSSVRDGVHIYYPRYKVFPRALFFASSGWRMYCGIRKTIESIYREFPFDIIHAHVALPDGYTGALLAQDFGKPLVVTIHGQDLQQTVHRGINCKEALAYVLHNAFKIIVVSEKLSRLTFEYFALDDKVIVISNGVNIQNTIKEDVKKGKHVNGNNIVLSVSNLVSIKGINFNIYAIKRLKDKYPNLEYWVVGSGPEENKLRGLVTRLGLEKRVKFLGRQPHPEVFKYMANCAVFSLPSWNEAYGVVYVEAMACGKPVIGCYGEGIEDFVEHGKNGLLVKPRDVDSLVEALDFLLSHPEEARLMGERARKVVTENYTWKKNAEKTIQVYREVLKVK